MGIHERLLGKWMDLMTPFGIMQAVALWGFDELTAAYSALERHYHNLEHLAAVLNVVDRLSDLADDPAAVRLAAWFHDAVYDPRARDNEERSAELLLIRGADWELPSALVEEGARLVQLTKTHAAGDEVNGPVLLDADLSILGAAPEEYARYAAAIRREYAWVDEPTYRSGRLKVLRGFLRRERIYRTQRAYEWYELGARANLGEEIGRLGGWDG